MRKGCFHTIGAHGPPPKPSSPRSLFHWHLDSDLFPKPFEGHKFILDVQSPVCICQVSRQKLSWTLFTQSTSLHLHTEPDSGSCCFQAAFYLLIAKNTNPKLPIGTLVIFAMNCPVKPGFLWDCIDRISTHRWVFSVQESLTVFPLQRQCAHPEAHFKSRVTRFQCCPTPAQCHHSRIQQCPSSTQCQRAGHGTLQALTGWEQLHSKKLFWHPKRNFEN